MVLSQICARIKIILIGLIGVFRRGLCCFSRRRKNSQSDCEILQSVNVISNTGKNNNIPEKDWNSWDDTPRTVQEHIDQYRQKLARPPTPQDAEPEPDFFQDMTPKIKTQTKIFVETQPDPGQVEFSRLKATADIPIPMAADLQDWTEEDAGGWEELDTESTKKLIREKRKEMRAQRQPKPKEAMSPVNFAEKMRTRYS